MLNPSNNSRQQQYTLLFLQQLIRSHPIACLGGLWVSLVLLGSVASVGLFNPGSIDQEGSKPTPTLETTQEFTPQSRIQKGLPLSFFGAVALGCAGGSLLVTQALKHSAERRYPAKRSKPVATVGKKRQQPSKTRPPLPRKPPPAASPQTFQTLNNRVATSPKTLTPVTVLPPEESHPLDRREESLADLLDLRKHHSLSSLMRGKSFL